MDLNNLYKKHKKELDAWEEWIQIKSIRKARLTKTTSLRIERYFDSSEIFDIMRQGMIEIKQHKIKNKLKNANPKIKKGYQ